MCILTADVDKNATVIGILVGPCIWIAVSVGQAAFQPTFLRPTWAAALAVLALPVGLGPQVYGFTRPSSHTMHRDEAQRILDSYEHLADAARVRHWAGPTIATNSFADFLFAPAINVVIYERHHNLLRAREVLATDLVAQSREEALGKLQQAQFAFDCRRLRRSQSEARSNDR